MPVGPRDYQAVVSTQLVTSRYHFLNQKQHTLQLILYIILTLCLTLDLTYMLWKRDLKIL